MDFFRSTLPDACGIVTAVELIVEIAAGSAAIDLHDKLRAYRRNGVQEYVVLARAGARARLVRPDR